MTDLINKIEKLRQERDKILKEFQEAKNNNNDVIFIKSLKNKYHSISNKINYNQDRDNIKEQKRIHNISNMTPERIEKCQEYARKYQRNIRDILKIYKSNISQSN